MFSGIAQDINHAFRGLRRSPGFTLTVIATLAVCVGINAAVFTVTKTVLFDGFPLVAQNDRIVYVTTTKNAVYYPDFEAWRSQATSLEDMGLARGVFKTFGANDVSPQTLFATEVTSNTFGLLGVRPMLGRDFLPADQQAGSEPVAILRYDLWVREFGKDPSIVGRSVRLSGTPTTVIGVMPEGFSFPEDQHLWTPLVPTSAALNRDTFFARYAFGRLAEGATIEGARAELAAIGARLASEYPRTNADLAPVVKTFSAWLLGANGTTLYMALWGAVSLVLLIGCANVANLLLGRALSRSRDVAIRSALGAGPTRIVRQLLAECLILSAAGGALGWWIAHAAVQAYAVTQPEFDAARALRFTMDERVVAYVLAISVGVGLLASLAAAVRLVTLDVNLAMKGHGALADGRGSRRMSKLLVGAQTTLAVVLLVNAGVLIHSFLNLSTADVGVDADGVLSMSLYLPPDTYPTDETQIAFYDRLEARLRSLPQVGSAGLGVVAPTEVARRTPFAIEDVPIEDEKSRPAVADIVVSSGYFRTLGATVLSGRDFNDFDRPTSLPVAIVNEQFAKQHWPNESAIDKRLRVFRDGRPQEWRTVVGVVTGIVQNDTTRQAFEPLLYLPYAQSPSRNMFAFARVRGDAQPLMPAVWREVSSLDANLPVPALMPLVDRLKRASAFGRNIAALLLAFGAIALLLASVGLYAAVSRAVVTRTREIGVRVAIGASARDVRELVFRTAQWPLVGGLSVGLIGAFAVSRTIDATLAGVSPADPLAFVAASVVLVLAASVGCLVPARRAMRIDPIVALKQE